MKKIFFFTNINYLFFILFNIFIFFSLPAYSLENEKYYSEMYCKELSGKVNYNLADKSKVDCLTDTHAYEVDWADGMKVYEAIGQSLYYASQTNKKPGIILLIRKNNSEKHIRKVKEVINFFELDINLIIKDLISKN